MKLLSTPSSRNVRSSTVAKFCALAFAAGVATLAYTPAAHAAPKVIFYQTGEEIFEAGDGKLPAPFDAEPELKSMKAGYKCDIFGVFWAYFSIKNCQPVAFVGDSVLADSELSAAIAKKAPESEMKVGGWGKWGKFPLILLVLGSLGLGALRFLRKNREEASA